LISYGKFIKTNRYASVGLSYLEHSLKFYKILDKKGGEKMKIRKLFAKKVKDSRGEKTIQVIVKTGFFKKVKTSAPSGESTGEHEVKSYAKSLDKDIIEINKLNVKEINKLDISTFNDLIKIENLVGGLVGGNSLFALESSLLKALANENGQELYEFLGKGKKLPRPVGNVVGGGMHSIGIRNKKPDFQEFLFIGHGKTVKESIEINNLAYKLIGKLLGAKKRNDEGAWETNKTNKEVLDAMTKVRHELRKQGKNIFIGLDVASSSFYKNKKYHPENREFSGSKTLKNQGVYDYKNKRVILTKDEQIKYIKKLIKKYEIYYIEDPLEENDFSGFTELRRAKSFIVGDDLTTTNPERFKKAIGMRSINAIIVKPNQIGSLIKVKEVIDIAKTNNIKTIISHRSGETMDDTIADLGVSWDCDFIKTGIYGKVRKAKLDRLVEIEKSLKK